LDGLFADSCVIGPRAAGAWPARSAGQYVWAGPARSAGQSFNSSRKLTTLVFGLSY